MVLRLLPPEWLISVVFVLPWSMWRSVFRVGGDKRGTNFKVGSARLANTALWQALCPPTLFDEHKYKYKPKYKYEYKQYKKLENTTLWPAWCSSLPFHQHRIHQNQKFERYEM